MKLIGSKLDKRANTIFLLGLVIAAFMIAFDIYEDSQDGAGLSHLLVELTTFTFLLGGAIFMAIRLFQARDLVADLRREVNQVQLEKKKWKEEAQVHIQGLVKTIDNQFSRWNLSASEKEVAYLLIKGLAFKEIADVRNTTEKTARQQSLAIYRKAGLEGRSDLSAFFIEDLLSDITPNVADMASDSYTLKT